VGQEKDNGGAFIELCLKGDRERRKRQSPTGYVERTGRRGAANALRNIDRTAPVLGKDRGKPGGRTRRSGVNHPLGKQKVKEKSIKE